MKLFAHLRLPVVLALSGLIVGCELTLAPTKVTSAPSEGTSASTRATSGATTGVTSSTTPGKARERKVKDYVADNFDRVKENMAVGGGPYLESLANLLDVSASRRAAFYGLIKSSYPVWFASAKTTPADITNRLNTLMAQHPELRK